MIHLHEDDTTATRFDSRADAHGAAVALNAGAGPEGYFYAAKTLPDGSWAVRADGNRPPVRWVDLVRYDAASEKGAISEGFALDVMQAHLRNALLEHLGDEPQPLVEALVAHAGTLIRGIYREPTAYGFTRNH